MPLKRLSTKRNSQKVFQINIYPELDRQIDLIITRNIKDFKYSKIGVMTPGNYVKSFITNGIVQISVSFLSQCLLILSFLRGVPCRP